MVYGTPNSGSAFSVEIEPYSSAWDQEPREDVDVFFRVRAPRDSARQIRPYPGTRRGLFASPDYIAACGNPVTSDELVARTCIGSGTWKLSRGRRSQLQISYSGLWSATRLFIKILYLVGWASPSCRFTSVSAPTCGTTASDTVALEHGTNHPLRSIFGAGASESNIQIRTRRQYGTRQSIVETRRNRSASHHLPSPRIASTLSPQIDNQHGHR
jgi:hypothetical protein